ncbi:MAG: sugar phosphate nucleotidyltransferase [Halobacteriota archaeon]
MQAVIPAAGRGTRLGALTARRPKGLVPVDGRPLIEHALEAAIQLGADELVVVIGYRGAAIRDHLGGAYGGRPVRYVEQPNPVGLADAVARAGAALEGDFVVVNADNVFSGELGGLRDRLLTTADGALLVETADAATARTTGVVDVADGRVVGVRERPDEPMSSLVTTGIYALPLDAVHACHLVTPSDRGERELAAAIDLLCRAGYHVEAIRFEGVRVNVNTPTDLGRAAAILSD